MGKIMRNGVPYCVGGDDAFRYVNDVTDENYGWIQYQLEDGSWVNYKQVETLIYPLYMSSANEGGFSAYAGALTSISWLTLKNPTATFSDDMSISINNAYGSVISNLVDLTDYEVLKFHHKTTSTAAADGCTLTVFVTQAKSSVMTAAAKNLFYLNLTSKEEDIEIDISNLSGEYYIGFEIFASNSSWTTTTEISNMYLE